MGTIDKNYICWSDPHLGLLSATMAQRVLPVGSMNTLVTS